MADNKTVDITEKIKAHLEEEQIGEVQKKAAEQKVTDPILTEKLLINHEKKNKFSIKDLLR